MIDLSFSDAAVDGVWRYMMVYAFGCMITGGRLLDDDSSMKLAWRMYCAAWLSIPLFGQFAVSAAVLLAPYAVMFMLRDIWFWGVVGAYCLGVLVNTDNSSVVSVYIGYASIAIYGMVASSPIVRRKLYS